MGDKSRVLYEAMALKDFQNTLIYLFFFIVLWWNIHFALGHLKVIILYTWPPKGNF